MIYPTNFEHKIGFDKIRQLISDKCLSPLGKDKVEEMDFSIQYDEVRALLCQTEEFVRILQVESDFPANYFFDVRQSLLKVRVEGTFLDESELFDLRRSLETIRDIVRFFLKEEEGDTQYPHLTEMAREVALFPQIIGSIDKILDKFGKVKDNASPELARIRKEILHTTSNISRTLQSILRVAQSEGIVEKDLTPTMRDGRLMIPVAPGFKRKIKGIVHDESASGKTVFIEPAEVVEANNRVRELESEERREVIRILVKFTDEIRPFAQEILSSYDFLSKIDFTRAKALLAISINGILPVFENQRTIDWGNAIHPLLYLSHKRQNKPVVPLDIQLNESRRLLIISGPNAGGKSVCLKTVGLLQYMLQNGLLIPVHESSRTGIFQDIFIDIGDEQSIENDLSTYSSHLTNMKFFVRNCTENSILLIDEFGGGTEPQIGGAIAEALLDRFNRNKAYGVITTHYQNLKHFAEDHEGIVNGAMLYDRHLMQPLFQLSIGNPGSSFAMEIARKIGLPEDVIADASAKVGSDYIDMDKYLQDIVRDKRYWEGKRQTIRQKEKKLEELTETYEADLHKIAKERKELMANAKMEATRILADANATIENTIRKIKEASAEKEATRDARKELDAFKAQLLTIESNGGDIISRKIKKIQDREERKKLIVAKPLDKKAFQPDVILVGDAVRLKGQNTVGEVLELQGKQVTVAFGMLKSTVLIDRLDKISKNQLKKESHKTTFVSKQTASDISERRLNFRSEIDVRGMRGDEALQAVVYFIDDAIMVGMGQVRILHGTGTGALRQIIRQYLQTVHGVKSIRDEHVQMGGTGITVVELD